MQPAFEQQAKGGPAENCPWAIYSHSAGCVLACSIAAKARKEYGLEPDCVFMVDQAPPNQPFLTDEGYELMCNGSRPLRATDDWMKVWCPELQRAKGKGQFADNTYERWSYGMRILEDFYRTAEQAYHKFHCPIYVIAGMVAFQDEAAERKIQEQRKAGKPKKPRQGLPEMYDIMAITKDSYFKWESWTTDKCEFIPVRALHHEIWYHLDTDTKLWQKFLEHSGVTPELLK